MRQSLNKNRPINHIANRNPSPDILNNHLLVETKIVVTKDTQDKKRQRVPIIQQISYLANENQKLRQQLYDSQSYKIKRQQDQKGKDKSESKIPNDKISRKINVTLSDVHLIQSKQLKPSSQSKTLSINGEVQKLKGIISELTKQNNQLRKSIIKNEDKSQQNVQQIKVKQWLENNMKSKFLQVQQSVNEKLKQIGYKVNKLQNNIKQRKNPNLDNSDISISRKKLSIVSPLKRPSISTRKEENSMFKTPASFKQNSQSNQTIDHLKQKLSSSKNNIVQLLKKNENLLQQNYQYKKAYDEMLKTQTKAFDHSPFTNIVIGEDSNSSLKQAIEKLQQQNRDLKLKNSSLEKSFTNMKHSQKSYSSGSGNNKQSNSHSQQKSKEYEKIIYDLEDKLSQLKFQNQQLRKHIFSFSKKDTSQNQIYVNNVQQQNSRLNDQLTLLQQQINKLQHKIQSLDKQKQDYMKYSQYTQNSQTKSGQHEDIRVRDEQIIRLQSELNHFIQQSQFNKQQINEIIDMKKVMNQFKIKLQQADRAIQEMQSNGIKHEVQIEGSLKDLQSVKRMLQSINFNQLQNSIQDLGYKYKTAVNERIQTLRSLNIQISQINRLNNQNEKNKLSALQLNNKYVNEKSEKQKLQSLLKHQQTQVQILQQQIKNLNDIMNEYINKNETKIRKDIQKYQNQTTQIDQVIIDDKTQTNILHLKQLERQFLVVSKRLEQVMGKMKSNLKENKQFAESRVRTYQI